MTVFLVLRWSVRICLQRWHRVFSGLDWPAEPNHSHCRDRPSVVDQSRRVGDVDGSESRVCACGQVVLCNVCLCVQQYDTAAPRSPSLTHQVISLISAEAAPCVIAFSFALVLRSVSQDNQPYSLPRILSSLPPLGVSVRCI
jgi:hypothetical protein